MSHFRQKTLKSVAVAALLTAAASAVTANAAVNALDYPGLKTPLAPTLSRTVPISALTSDTSGPILDWQNPDYSLKFDVPDTDWTTSLQLLLSADPVGKVSPHTDIYVQVNQGAPTKIASKSRGFDARVSLDPTKIRSRGNVLRVYISPAKGADCLQKQDGAWAVNLKASTLTLRRHAKTRNLRISDIEDYLTNPLTAPKIVSLLAQSESSAQLQALLAQAVSLRMDSPPKFTTLAKGGDIVVIAGRRDQISHLVKNDAVMAASGPRLAADDGRPMRIILTGDTDADVLGLVQTFAEHRLPASRRTMVSTGEIMLQSDFSFRQRISDGRIDLAALAASSDADWNPARQTLNFDIEDPKASHGEVLLRLAAPKTTLTDSNTLSLTLNGQPIGQTSLDKTRKSVAFTIPAGILRGQNNVLTATADIQSKNLTSCAAQSYAASGLYFGEGSRLTVSKTGETPLSDLSRLTATGAPFSDADGQDTLIVLPKNNADYNAALTLMGTFAKTDGAGWTNAQYTRQSGDIIARSKGRNVLFILPSNEIPQSAKSTAPKSLLSALRGDTQTGHNLLSVETERYASANAQTTLQTAALSTAKRGQIYRGGVAALYASPYQSGKMLGVISNVPGQSFRESLKTFAKPDHWNTLEGSVARWTEQSVLMAELSSPLPGFTRTKSSTADTVSNIGLQSFNWPNFKRPTFDVSGFSFPDLQVPDVQLPHMDWTQIKAAAFFWKKENVFSAEHPELAPPKYETPSSEVFALNETARANESVMENAAVSQNEPLRDQVLAETDQPSMPEASSHTDPIDIQPHLKQAPETNITDRPSSLIDTAFLNEKTQIALNLTQQTWTQVTASIPDIPDLKIGERAASLQKQIKPMSAGWLANIRRASMPGQYVSEWSLRQLSAVAVLLILIFGLIMVSLGLSAPRGQSKK